MPRKFAPIAMKLPEVSNIQILRGIAALLVVLYHIPDDLADRGWTSPFPIMYVGAAGVDLFFVISGFIMVYSTVDLFGKPGAPLRFLVRRCARIVPLYWLFTTLYVVITVQQSRHVHPADYSIGHFIASYLFTFYLRPGADDFPIYRPGWSLNYEMFFYLCFACALVLRRSKALLVLSAVFVALTGLAVAALMWHLKLPWLLDEWANTDLLEFVFGMVLAQLYLKGFRLSRPIAILGAALALLVLTISSFDVDDWFPYRGFVWGPPAAIVVGAAVLCRPYPSGRIRRFFEALGDASYSLYLVHSAFFMVLAYALGRVMDVHRIAVVPYAGIMLFGAIALAFALYRFVERPMTGLLQRRLNRAGSNVAPSPVSSVALLDRP